MLSSRAERIGLALTVAVIALLASLMTLGVLRYRDQAKSSSATGLSAVERLLRRHQLSQGSEPAAPRAKRPPPGKTPATVSPSAPEQVAARSAGRNSPAFAARVTITLSAARGDCWAEVRARSDGGRVLFAGIIARGQSRSFRGRRLWMRLGAPERIDASIDGKDASIPSGTLNMIATRRGFTTSVDSAAAT